MEEKLHPLSRWLFTYFTESWGAPFWSTFSFSMAMAGLMSLVLGLVYNDITSFSPIGGIGINHKLDLVDSKTTKNAEEIRRLKDSLEPGKGYPKHEFAFDDAAEILREIAEEGSNAEIDIHMIGVSMRYSKDYIMGHLRKTYDANPDVHFSYKIAHVDYKYLNSFNLDREEFDWAEGLRENLKELKKFSKSVKNVDISLFPFCSIPQRHGILIDRNHLFLGRTDWEFNTKSGSPMIRVGERHYIYYQSRSRVNLFRHWFSFFSNMNNYKGN